MSVTPHPAWATLSATHQAALIGAIGPRIALAPDGAQGGDFLDVTDQAVASVVLADLPLLVENADTTVAALTDRVAELEQRLAALLQRLDVSGG